MHHHVKSYICSVEVIKELVKCGFGPNELDENGDSVLSLYLRSFYLCLQVDVFDCLVENGASMNWLGAGMQSLIHLVIYQSDRENALVLERLLKCGIDIKAKDTDGRGILHHGAIHGAL